MDATAETKDLTTIHKAMVDRLSGVAVPQFSVFPTPSQFEDVREYIAAVSRIMDAWLYRVGMEAASNTHGLNLTMFTDVFTKTTQGNCEYALTEAANALCDEIYEDNAHRRSAYWRGN